MASRLMSGVSADAAEGATERRCQRMTLPTPDIRSNRASHICARGRSIPRTSAAIMAPWNNAHLTASNSPAAPRVAGAASAGSGHIRDAGSSGPRAAGTTGAGADEAATATAPHPQLRAQRSRPSTETASATPHPPDPARSSSCGRAAGVAALTGRDHRVVSPAARRSQQRLAPGRSAFADVA